MKNDLHFYTAIFENWDHLKGAGLLTDQRIEEVKNCLSPAQFTEVKLEDGRTIKDWVCHKLSGKVFPQMTKDHYFYSIVLNGFFTEAEAEALNKDANKIWRKKCEDRNFEKAEKIPVKDWSGPIFSDGLGYRGGYFDCYEDLLDFFDEMTDTEGCDFEQPTYVWACIKNPITLIDLDWVLEHSTEDIEDLKSDDLKGLADLKQAVEDFNNANSGFTYLDIDRTKAILL